MTDAELQITLDDEDAPNKPQQLAGLSAPIGRVPPDEARERRSLMSNALANRVPRDSIIKSFEARYGMSASGVRKLITDVHASWKDEDDENRPYAKAAQRRRMHTHIPAAAAAGKWTAVAALEKGLAEIEGNDVQEIDTESDVDSRLTDAVLHVLGQQNTAGMRVLIERERTYIEMSPGNVPVKHALPIDTKVIIDVEGGG